MSNIDKNIKIFVSHRIDFDSIKIENDVFIPVRCGACFDKRKDTNIIGDNSGINISNKRESYCELTVQYWAWKNIDADYYGICHYRRYLSFNEKAASDLNDWSNIVLPNINSKIIDQHFLNNIDYIKNKVSSYDVVTMIPVDLRKVDRKSVYEQYQKDGVRLHISDIDIMLNIIDERYPEFSDIAHSYMYGSVAYIGNIFIMKKEFFHNYCSWLFDILSEFEKRVDMSNYSMEAYRTPGHLGERLFGIYYTWLKKNKNIKAL